MGRPHVARALVEAGHVATVAEAFDKYLGTGKPAYIEKERFAIEVMHPDVNKPDRQRYTSLPRFRGKFTTGGSDDHGKVKTTETLGTVRVAEELIRPILDRL